MKVTEFGIVMLDNDKLLKKQQFPMEITEFGIAILDNEE
jgi:hypothetical protein